MKKSLNVRQKLIIWMYDNNVNRIQLGKMVGVTAKQVSNWLLLNLPQRPKREHAYKLEEVTQGFIKAKEIDERY